MTSPIDQRSFYRGHVLTCHPAAQDDGRFQARVAIVCVGSDASLSQRFLDLEVCATRDAALEKARQAGIAWVDQECSARRGPPGSSDPPR